MVMIGLGCVLALTAGLATGVRLADRFVPASGDRPTSAFTFKTLFATYLGAVVAAGALQQVAWQYPAITQALIALSYIRLGLLFLVFRRLTAPTFNWPVIGGLLAFEVVLGFTGYFANFREPLVLATLAAMEVFDSTRARHWLSITAMAVVLAITSLFWMSVRTGYRQAFWEEDNFATSRSARLDRLSAMTTGWTDRDADDFRADVDNLVERLWAIYYPALAVERVPTVLAHTDGALMRDVLTHIMSPRVFYSNKPGLISDSDLVRRYSGVWVAGAAENTNIAFGYAAESYIDYGVPWMFLPVVIYGVFIGAAYQGFLLAVAHRDLAVGLVTVICWLSLYLFERSWAKTVGLAGTLMIYVGGITLVLDRLWIEKYRSLRVMSGYMPAPSFDDQPWLPDSSERDRDQRRAG
jgi:hypothetical protein